MKKLARGPLDRWLTGALLLAALFLCFFKLTYLDLQEWDEADNIGVLLESADAGHPFELQRMGEPYFDKPHLWYALTQGLILILGRTELAFRLVTASAGFALIVLVILAARRFFSPLAGLAAGSFMLAITQHFVFRPGNMFATHHLRSADSDALMILFLFAAFYALARRFHGWRPGLAVAGLCTGLGLLAKGPLALMPLVAFALYQLVSPARIRLSGREIALAFGTFALVAVPWHLAMLWISGADFFDKYIAYIAQRVTSGLPGHKPDDFYYLRLLGFKRVFFGGEISLAAIVTILLRRSRLWRFERAGALLTFACIALVLQLSRTKLAWYVLPLYPFLAIAVAALVADLEELLPRRAAAAALAAIAALTAPFAAYDAYAIARLRRGKAQIFFSGVKERCGDDVVYADARDSVHIHYFLLRHRLREGLLGEGTCKVTRTDTVLPAGFTATNREVTRGGGFVLWTSRPVPARDGR